VFFDNFDLMNIKLETLRKKGVETEVQKVYLERVGCDWIQGYLVSKPVIKEEAIKLINP